MLGRVFVFPILVVFLGYSCLLVRLWRFAASNATEGLDWLDIARVAVCGAGAKLEGLDIEGDLKRNSHRY